MGKCDLITMHRAHLRRKAEFEEQEKIDLAHTPFTDAVIEEHKRADEERQRNWNRDLVKDGRDKLHE